MKVLDDLRIFRHRRLSLDGCGRNFHLGVIDPPLLLALLISTTRHNPPRRPVGSWRGLGGQKWRRRSDWIRGLQHEGVIRAGTMADGRPVE